MQLCFRRLLPVVAFCLLLASTSAWACDWRSSGFNYLKVENSGGIKEFSLELQDKSIKMNNDFIFHNVSANFYCDNCYESLRVDAAVRVHSSKALDDIKYKITHSGVTFEEFSINVYQSPRADLVSDVFEQRKIRIGSMSGNILGRYFRPRSADVPYILVNFYAADECTMVFGVFIAMPRGDASRTLAGLGRLAENLALSEVDGNSISSRDQAGRPTPNRMPPFTLDDLRSLRAPRSSTGP